MFSFMREFLLHPVQQMQHPSQVLTVHEIKVHIKHIQITPPHVLRSDRVCECLCGHQYITHVRLLLASTELPHYQCIRTISCAPTDSEPHCETAFH